MVLSGQFDMTPGWRKPPRPGVAQQGKLFHGGPKPTEEQIQWARGYGPTRMHEIEENIGPVMIQHGETTHRHPFFPQAIQERSAQLHKGDLPGMSLEEQVRAGNQLSLSAHTAAHHAVVDTLARSTIKPKSLDKPTIIFRPHNENQLGSYQGYDKIVSLHAPQVAEQTTPSKYMKQMQQNFPGQFGDERYTAEGTLIHEIGHHHSSTWNPEKGYKTAQEKGEEEAYADAFMAAHQRRHPQDNRPEAIVRAYNFGQLPNANFAEPQESRRWYERALPERMEQFGATAPAPGSREAQRMWKEHEHGPEPTYEPKHQPHLFGRSADVSKTTGVPDYGQWGYEDYTKEGTHYLDQLRVGTPPVPEDRSKWNTGKIL